MRLGTANEPSGLRSIVVVADIAVDLEAAAGSAIDLDGALPMSATRRLLTAGPEALAAVEKKATELAAEAGAPTAIPLDEVTLGPPVPDPQKILCLGLNYGDHIAESGLARPEVPEFFAKFQNALVGPTADVPMPGISEQWDWEGELAVVIGKQAKNISVDDARDHVAGYMILNDVSSRDIQMRGSQWLPGKIQDASAPCGPFLVTADTIDDPQNLALKTTVNGDVMQESNTSHQVFNIAEGVAYLSTILTLEPGDIISTGTPAGVAYGQDDPTYLVPGDIVEVEIEQLGKLRNEIVTAV